MLNKLYLKDNFFAECKRMAQNGHPDNITCDATKKIKNVILQNDKRVKTRSYSSICRCLVLVNISFHGNIQNA